MRQPHNYKIIEEYRKQLKYKDEQLNKTFIIDIQRIIKYRQIHKEKNLKNENLIMSGELYDEILKNTDYQQFKFIDDKIDVLFGMNVIIRNDITGWYIQ